MWLDYSDCNSLIAKKKKKDTFNPYHYYLSYLSLHTLEAFRLYTVVYI